MTSSEQEPLIHSGITDELPEGHPLYWQTVKCDECGVYVHATPNENMCTWIEFSNANVCAECVGSLAELHHENVWPFRKPST